MRLTKISTIYNAERVSDILSGIPDEEINCVNYINHAGMSVAKCFKHPEYGDFVLITTGESGGLMLHA
jgi:hypothetical protein